MSGKPLPASESAPKGRIIESSLIKPAHAQGQPRECVFDLVRQYERQTTVCLGLALDYAFLRFCVCVCVCY